MTLSATLLEELVTIAARSVVSAVQSLPEAAVTTGGGPLAERGASFVTLRQDTQLRGCIGSVHAYRRLDRDVCANARAAALDDPRFPALTRSELAYTTIEVSVLSTPMPLDFTDADDLMAQLRPHVDGLSVRHDTLHATYLPAVWQQVPSAPDFIRALREKAGISLALPLTALSFERYTSTSSPAARILDQRFARERVGSRAASDK